MDGLQIRITRCIVIGRLSKQQQDISGKRAERLGNLVPRLFSELANGLCECPVVVLKADQ